MRPTTAGFLRAGGTADAAPAGGLPDFAAMTEEEYMDWKLENSVKVPSCSSVPNAARARCAP